MTNGYLRVASVSPIVTIANVRENVTQIKNLVNSLEKEGIDIAVFPELSITGYTCADLLHNTLLLDEAATAVEDLNNYCKNLNIDIIVGVPLFRGAQIYNCAAFISNGEVKIIDKSYLPNYNEFYEKRWFATPVADNSIVLASHGVKIGVEICEDLWSPIPPSCNLSLHGAEVIFNLSASNDVVGKYDYLRQLVIQQSARCLCGYVYTSSGIGESSTDLVFTPKNIIAECGNLLAEGNRFDASLMASIKIAELDIETIRRERFHNTTFATCMRNAGTALQNVDFELNNDEWDFSFKLPYRKINPYPFIPKGNDGNNRLDEILFLQTAGLYQRLSAINCKSLVIGISGGLDSTLALIIAVMAFDRLGLPRKNILGVTMPGFGTTDRTYGNAIRLMTDLGISIREIPIANAVLQHFKDIGHNPSVTDITYENSQARERTQILMDIANQTNGIVLGTGDLSELALGWATYNGDQMSMYGVNAGVPKTLVKSLVRRYAETQSHCNIKDLLADILNTPISPELTPSDSEGNIAQKTENIVGPYELHDFFIFYTLRFGFSPRKIFMLARKAFEGKYDSETIIKWLETFYKRFFTQQFKRSCMPDGVKIGSVCLSPRGDWRMPSDASYALWIEQINQLKTKIKDN